MANFTLSIAAPLSDSPVISAAAYSSSPSSTADDVYDDACSICLEAFTSQDPAAATCCKHEYHLQCILEWSQRSKECPICWQLLVLKDPSSQELLAAIETQRRMRSRNTPTVSTSLHQFHEDYDAEQDSFSDDSDFNEHIMQHLAGTASRPRYVRISEGQRSSEPSSSQIFVYTSSNVSSVQQRQTYTEVKILDDDLAALDFSTSGTSISAMPTVPPLVDGVTSDAVDTDSPFKQRVFFKRPRDSLRGPGSSEIRSFSDSIKTKWFAASARYKESISKSSRGIKEKLLAHNNSVKELSKGVHREVSAGLAGVARMIERLELTPKRNDASGPVSHSTEIISDFSWKGNGMTESIVAQNLGRKTEQTAPGISSNAAARVYGTVPSQMEVPTCSEAVDAMVRGRLTVLSILMRRGM